MQIFPYLKESISGLPGLTPMAVAISLISTDFIIFHRLGHPRTALQYLEKALELEDCLEDASFKADTHLNLSAVLS